MLTLTKWLERNSWGRQFLKCVRITYLWGSSAQHPRRSPWWHKLIHILTKNLCVKECLGALLKWLVEICSFQISKYTIKKTVMLRPLLSVLHYRDVIKGWWSDAFRRADCNDVVRKKGITLAQLCTSLLLWNKVVKNEPRLHPALPLMKSTSIDLSKKYHISTHSFVFT